jgi:radical SAM superfamily enzyme YgiQ (UPF0313 family)
MSSKRTDVLLVVPPFTYVKLEEAGPACPNLGIAYVAAVLEKNGYRARILDTIAENLKNEEIREAIKKISAPIIGVTAVTSEFPQAMKLFKIIKQINRKTITILGGPHATIMPLSANSDLIDYLVIGEGEYTTLELVDYLIKKKGDLSKIKGIAYRKNSKLIINPPRDLIKNIDGLPFPAYHLLPMDKYKPYAIFDLGLKFTSVITSRGCPFRCTYCTSSSVFGHKWRGMSPAKVVELLKMLNQKFGIKHFYFQDDEFTINHKRTIEICDLIIKSKMKIVWECLSRADHITEELISKMHGAGCRGIVYGIETGYQEGLEKIKKCITLDQVRNAVKLSKKYKIHTRGSFMMGFPWESKKEIKKTINFAKSLDLNIVYFQILTPYPGTEIYEQMKKENLIVANDWERFVQHSIVGTEPLIRTRHLTTKELKYWNAIGFLSFYLRPRYMLKKLLSEGGKTNFRRTAKTGYGLIRNAIKVILA